MRVWFRVWIRARHRSSLLKLVHMICIMICVPNSIARISIHIGEKSMYLGLIKHPHLKRIHHSPWCTTAITICRSIHLNRQDEWSSPSDSSYYSIPFGRPYYQMAASETFDHRIHQTEDRQRFQGGHFMAKYVALFRMSKTT